MCSFISGVTAFDSLGSQQLLERLFLGKPHSGMPLFLLCMCECECCVSNLHACLAVISIILSLFYSFDCMCLW